MNILIFGGAGFVGRHYTEHFLRNGEFVYIIDNIDPLFFENEIAFSSNFFLG